jgi:hypothetical protein
MIRVKEEHDPLGLLTGAKARLVVCANSLSDFYHDVFAPTPTVNEKSYKLLFAVCVFYGMKMTGVDVKGAFLYPDQVKPVYVALPKHLCGPDLVFWKLNKTLYGLPESSQAFYNHVATVLLSNGYTQPVLRQILACSSRDRTIS